MQVRAEYLDVDGSAGFVEHRGSGPAVVCIHTAGQSGRQWRDVLAALPDLGWSVYVPDLPGHGRSDLLPAGPVETIEGYAGWVGEVVDRLDLRDALVVGCSIGAKIALQLAIDRPDRLRGVVAMAADAKSRYLSESGLRRSLEDAGSPSRSDRTFYGTLAAVGASVPADRAEAIAARHRCEDPEVATTDLVAWINHDLGVRAGAIRCPVQLAYGTDDFWIDPCGVEALAASIPRSRCEVLESIGHYPMEEDPGFTDRLQQWLRWVDEAAG